MSATHPLVTTIITAMTDAERTLAPIAISSALSQSVSNQILVFLRDDCLWVEEIAISFPAVRIMRVPLTPLGKLRNIGVRLAQTEWIAFLDGDDEWVQGKLAAQLSCAANTGSEFIGCDHVMIDEKGISFAFGISRYYPYPSSWLVRREQLLNRPFEENVPNNAEDWIWFQTESRALGARRLPHIFLRYRVRRSSMSSWDWYKLRKERILSWATIPGVRLPMLGASWLARYAFIDDRYVFNSNL